MSFMSLLSAWFLASICICHWPIVKANDDAYKAQSRLLKDLLPDYDKTAHPSPSPGVPVNVTLGLAIAQIVSVEEKTEGVNINVWHRMGWKDYRLTWDPALYNDVTVVLLESEYIWIPDITLYKPISVAGTKVLGEKQDEEDLSWKIVLQSDGSISYNFPGMIYGQCPLNIADYPFDQHNCSFLFSSWVHDENEINLALRPGNAIDFGNYIENNEWQVENYGSQAYTLLYNCCPNGFKMVNFYITIKRGASSYISNYIIPSILIIVLSLMMFTLPPEVGKRMEIGINLLLCLSVYLTILNTKMPTRSDVFPLLSKFYGCCIFILTLALLCTCWVVTYYFHDMSGWKIYTMSKFVQIVVLHYLKRILRFPGENKVQPLKVGFREAKTIIVKPKDVDASQDKPPRNKQGAEKPTKKNKKDKADTLDDVEKKQQKKEREKVDERKKKKSQSEDAGNDRKKDRSRSENAEQKKDRSRSQDARNDKKDRSRSQDAELEKKDKARSEDTRSDRKERSRPQDTGQEKKDRSRSENAGRDKKERSRKGESMAMEELRENNERTAVKDNTKKKRPSVVSTSDKQQSRPSKGNVVKIEKNPPRDQENGETNKGFDNKKPSIRQEPSLKNKTDKDEDADKNKERSFDVKSEKRAQEKNENAAQDGAELLRHLASYFTENSQRQNNRNQWRQAAIVLNRLFTIMLATSIVLITIAIFLAR